MRRILESCVALDRTAYETYRALADACPEPELATIFKQLAKEEKEHVDWWSDLLMAWEGGLVPTYADEDEMVARLEEITAEVNELIGSPLQDLSTDDMLDLAARMEFFMLDPVFGELVDLMRPGGSGRTRQAYSAHILRLVEAIENHYSREGLSRFLARVLKRSYRDQQRLASLALHDHLTGLFNRRGIIGHLRQWLAWSMRYHRPFALAMLDIDGFKKLNDTLGHMAGDKALCAIARTLEETVRESDLVGRFGGDEFIVIAPETDDDQMFALMDRLVTAVRETPVVIDDGESIDVSISIGGAWMSGDTEMSVDEIIAAADRSLYAAKTAGRDRTGLVLTVPGVPLA